MNTNNVFEICLLQNNNALRSNDALYHHYKVILWERDAFHEKEKRPQNIKDLITIINSMKKALESYPPFAYIFKNHVEWINGHKDVSKNQDKPVKIYHLTNHPYCLLLHVIPINTCYVINHVAIDDDTINKVINAQNNVVISRVFPQKERPSVIVNIELDILRIALAILLEDYDGIMKVDSESLDYMEGILTNDDLKTKFFNSKSLARRINGKTTRNMYELNEHVCHYMAQIHHLWGNEAEYPYIPLMLLLDSVNKKRCCQKLNYPHFMVHHGLRHVATAAKLIKNDMISTNLSTNLHNLLEKSLTPHSIKHPYPDRDDYVEKKSIIDEKASILHSMMNNDYVERELTKFDVRLREVSQTKKKKNMSSLTPMEYSESSSLSEDSYDSYYSLDDIDDVEES